MSTGCVVLAGGLARRMGGVDKGLVMLAGQPMIRYALQTMQPLVDHCVINANRYIDTYEQLGSPVIQDRLDGHQGPLAGLSAALASIDAEHICLCPCDSPFLQAELFERLLQDCRAHDADVAVAHDGERLQPVFLVVNRRASDSLEAFLAAGERKIDRWFDTLATVRHVPCASFAISFRNINTEAERLQAEQELLS